MLCERCLGIELAEDPDSDISYRHSSNLDVLSDSGRAGCEGCKFFYDMLLRSRRLIVRMDPSLPLPTETRAVWIRSKTDENSVLTDMKIELEASAPLMFMLMEPFLTRGTATSTLLVPR